MGSMPKRSSSMQAHWLSFDQSLDEARARFEDLSPGALQDLIDEA